MDAAIRERQKNLSLALVLSAGLHLIAILTLDVSPGDWRHGFQPALRVVLKEAVREEPGPTIEKKTEQGRSASLKQPGSSLPLGDRYFRRSEVDVAAVPLQRAPLVYPEEAYLSRLAGTVTARVYISESGSVDTVEIVKVQPRGGVFEQAAAEALRQVRYQPAQIGGKAVKSQRLIEVTFNPYEEPDPSAD
jgi:TonB family protein